LVCSSKQQISRSFNVKTLEELHVLIEEYVQSCRNKVRERIFLKGRKSPNAQREWKRTWQNLSRIERVLDVNNQWPLSKLLKGIGRSEEKAVVLLLLGKELAMANESDDLFTGKGLAIAVAENPENEISSSIRVLSKDGNLIRKELIRPCNGKGNFADTSQAGTIKIEYELSDSALEQLELQQHQTEKWKAAGLIMPRLRMSDLVLSKNILDEIGLGLTQVKQRHLIMDNWGLGEKFAYGKAVTMLFYGPPGTGKTASAEAIADEIKAPLMVADYSKIQNCYVGNTEKNIAKAFYKATQHNAVLFWDEVDGLLSDRDISRQRYEVKHINIFLSEIEKFDGVCILATNRHQTLDKALERRITLKIEFPRPGLAERKRLWEVLLPDKLPLNKDVCVEELAEFDLSGGQIKNVILNSARRSASRTNAQAVTHADLLESINNERGYNRGEEHLTRVGFRAVGRGA